MKKPIKKKLPKYPLGGKKPIAPAAIQKDPNYISTDGNEVTWDGVTQSNNRANAGQYAMAGTAALANANLMYNNTPGSQGVKTAAAINGGIDAAAGILTPWYGIAKGASNLGKSFIPQNSVTDPTTGEVIKQGKTDAGEAAINMLTPHHETVINDFTSGDYKRGILDLFTGGVYNMLDNYYNKTNRKKYDAAVEANKPAPIPETFDKDYRQDAVWQKLNNYQEFAMGGINSGIPNSSIEKQEVVQNPDGTTQQVNVGTHESGNDAQVNLEPGARVFSDRLKLPGSKKTIAKEAEAFKTDKEEKVLSDPKSTSTSKNTAKLISDMKQRKLDELFQAQEALKQSKVLNYAKKLGVNIPQNQFKMGGMKSNCYPNGGVKLPKYRNGTEIPYTTPDPYSNEKVIPMTVDNTNNPVYNWNYLPTSQAPVINDSNSSSYDAMKSRNIYEGIGNGLVQNAGNFYDLYQTNMGRKYDIEDYGSVNPRYYNPKTISATESLRDADRQAAASRYALRNAVGGNTGAYLANLAANQTANTLNKAKIRESINNTNTNILNQADLTNTGIRNDAERYNLDLKYRAKVDTSMNKARSEDIARQAVRGIGENLSESYKDYKLGEQDQKKLALINQIFPNYKFNPNNFEFYYRSAKQANKPKKEKE